MMRNSLQKGFLVSLAVFGFFFSPGVLLGETPEEKGLRIAKELDAANNGFVGEESKMELLLINAQGDKIERRMLSRLKEVPNDGDKGIITFEWPADVKGTRMLTWSHQKIDDDQWLYLPSLKRVKRIAARNKTGSFMGSEFSYEDLGSFEYQKYRWKFLRDDKVEGRPVWVLEAIPTDPQSGYSKQISYADQEYMNPVKIEYYDRKGELLKTSLFQKYEKHGKLWRIGQIDMTNHQTSKRSILTWKDRTVGKNFPDRDFNKENLEG